MFETHAAGKTLFQKLESLEKDGKLGPGPLAFARGRDFLVKHDEGITDMVITYMSVDDVRDVLAFLELFFRSLQEHGVPLGTDAH